MNPSSDAHARLKAALDAVRSELAGAVQRELDRHRAAFCELHERTVPELCAKAFATAAADLVRLGEEEARRMAEAARQEVQSELQGQMETLKLKLKARVAAEAALRLQLEAEQTEQAALADELAKTLDERDRAHKELIAVRTELETVKSAPSARPESLQVEAQATRHVSQRHVPAVPTWPEPAASEPPHSDFLMAAVMLDSHSSETAGPAFTPDDRVRHKKRLADSINAIDQANTLSEVLKVLVDLLAQEFPRVAVLVTKGGLLTVWRSVGFDDFRDELRQLESTLTAQLLTGGGLGAADAVVVRPVAAVERAAIDPVEQLESTLTSQLLALGGALPQPDVLRAGCEPASITGPVRVTVALPIVLNSTVVAAAYADVIAPNGRDGSATESSNVLYAKALVAHSTQRLMVLTAARRR